MGAQESLARMFVALSATNEAVLRSKSEQDLYQRICNTALDSGRILGAVIFLIEREFSTFRMAASAGPFIDLIAELETSFATSNPLGQWLGGEAFSTGRPCICNDVLNDPRAKAWKRLASSAGLKSCIAMPLLLDDRPVGVMYFFFDRGSGQLDDETTRLIALMAENVSFGLAMFQRERQQDRLTRMFAALSAMNGAIMRAKSRDELFQQVCDAAVLGSDFAAVTVALAEPDSDLLRIVATAGPDNGGIRRAPLSICATRPEGRGLTGNAFRSRRFSISNDYLADPRMVPWHEGAREGGVRSGTGFPLLKNGDSIGILLIHSKRIGAFTPELVELLQRHADNISFALENFDRAEEKIKADEQIKYLATHDGLTNLPNRALFAQLTNVSIEIARRYSKKIALLFIDLDRFKIINDTLGHAEGDEVLMEIANRLRQSLRSSDVVARLGGDEFVVMIPELVDEQEVEAIARKLLSAVMQPVILRGQECQVTASIGVALYPDHGKDEQTLTKHADMAMYLAKDEGKNGFRLFSDNMKSQPVERLIPEPKLCNALDRD